MTARKNYKQQGHGCWHSVVSSTEYNRRNNRSGLLYQRRLLPSTFQTQGNVTCDEEPGYLSRYTTSSQAGLRFQTGTVLHNVQTGSGAHPAFYPRGKSTRYALNWRLGGPQNRSGYCGVETNLLPFTGTEPRPFGPQPVVIPTEQYSFLLWAYCSINGALNGKNNMSSNGKKTSE
jgi:hypothetical protein